MTPPNEQYDIVIIGAGIAGATVARELSKYKISLAVVEKEADVSFGSTKATHAIVHCGIPGKESPLKDKGELHGNLMMDRLCEEMDVPYKKIGKLLVGFNEEELNILRKIEKKTIENGVPGVELIENKQRLREMEPNLSEQVIAALYTPTTGAVDPWSLVIGLIENAVANGVILQLNTSVSHIERTPDNDFLLNTTKGPIRASYVINAAGVHAGKIAKMIGDESFQLKGSRQQRIILDKRCQGMVNHVVRGLNGENATGNFIFPTADGNIMVGCKVEMVEDFEDTRTTEEGLKDWVIPQYLKMIPGLEPFHSIKPFAGVIPLAGSDYHIQPAPDCPGFINHVLGGSGFTASPAMAKYLVEKVLPDVGLRLEQKANFNPHRKNIPHFIELSNEERSELIAKEPAYGHIVCRCETVSEGEIVEAMRRGATTRDGIKFRTRAGMGRCQSNFCGHKVLEIMSRALGVPPGKISRKGPGSEELR